MPKVLPAAALGGLIAGLAIATPVTAQQSETGARSGGLEEIVVTARRREEFSQDVPIALSVFDPDMLDAAQIRNVVDFNFAVPSVAIQPTQASQNSANVFIRGIGQDLSTILTESSVGIYVDGVFFARQIGGLIDLVDIERVEILRGPQGTLYGRNNLGGALKLETARPSTDAMTYIADFTTGSFDRVDVRGAVNVPVSDSVAFNVSALSRSDSGYYTHAETGGELNRKDSQTLRSRLLWDASEDVTVLLSADFSRDRSGLQVGTPFTSDDPSVGVPVYGGDFLSAPALDDLNRFRGWGSSAMVEWNLPAGMIISTTAFRRIDYVQAYDLSATPFESPANRPWPTQKLTREFMQRQITQELQYNSDWSGPFNLTTGVFYLREEGEEDLGFVLAPGFSLPFIAEQTSRSMAAYVEGTYSFSEALGLTVGGRFTRDRKDIDRDGLFAGLSGEYSESRFTPRVILNFAPTDDSMVYASYSEGYQAGEFQPFPADISSAIFATLPQQVKAYEVGAKTEWFDNRVRANLSVFRNNYDDLAVGIVGDGNLVEQTSADVRVQGIELEVLALATDRLSFSGYISRLNSKYTRAPGGELNPQVGEQAKNAPPWSGRLSGEYALPMGTDGEVVFGGGYTYTDDYYVLVPNIPWYLVESRGLLDARIAYRNEASGWQIELAGRNLTNELYALQSTLLSGPMRYYSPGRTWSLQFRILSR